MAILSICAANAGLNLSAASLVVFGELFWNPGVCHGFNFLHFIYDTVYKVIFAPYYFSPFALANSFALSLNCPDKVVNEETV